MINLIKNEIIKIVHKKSIIVLVLFISGMLLFSFLLDSLFIYDSADNSYLQFEYDRYMKNLDTYDLDKKEDLKLYVEDLSMAQMYKLLIDYNEVDSPEYYYIENNISVVLTQMNTAKYLEKNETDYQMYKNQYDEMVRKLKKFNWKKDLENEKKEVLEEIRLLENDKDVDSKIIQTLKYKVEALDYRIEYDAPYAYTRVSDLIDEYEDAAIAYLNLNKDESTYKKREELIYKREVEEKYLTLKYNLENKMIESENVENTKNAIVDMFLYFDPILLLALLVIVGGVIADEFSKGTIKQLLVRPFTRNQILWSKIIGTLIVSLFFALGYYLINILYFALSYNEIGVLLSNVVEYNFNTESIVEMNILLYCLLNAIALLPQYLIIFALALFVGVLSTNAIGSMCSGFGLLFFMGMIDLILNDKIRAILPMYCWDFTPYLFGGLSMNPYASFGTSIVVCSITFVLLIFGCFCFFNKKDIKNQ